MKTYILKLALIATLTQGSFASEKLFSCYRPINPYDPSFGQGQEMFLDIYSTNEIGTRLEMARMEGEKLIIKTGKVLNYNEEQSTVSVRFERGLLSMVYMGGIYWGAFLNNDQDPSFPQENEFMCRELVDITERL